MILLSIGLLRQKVGHYIFKPVLFSLFFFSVSSPNSNKLSNRSKSFVIETILKLEREKKGVLWIARLGEIV